MDQPAGSQSRHGFQNSYPVRWTGRHAIVALPEHIGQANARQVSEQLLSVINRGADALIVDMTATISCDYTGADALLRARQRAIASGTEMRLAVTDHIVRRALSLSGLNHLISSYPSLEAAIAASEPTAAAPPPDADDRPAITPEVLRELVDALDDGVALADRDGVMVLASRRLEEMFGYQHAELLGRRVGSLIPDCLPEARPGARKNGARKNGARFPVEVRSTPVHTAAAQYTLTIIREVTPRAESSRAATGPLITEALRHIAGGMRGIREIVLTASRRRTAPRQATPDGARAASGPRAGTG
jgi:anti-anti-sigma factor